MERKYKQNVGNGVEDIQRVAKEVVDKSKGNMLQKIKNGDGQKKCRK